jgi:hypothetical protein
MYESLSSVSLVINGVAIRYGVICFTKRETLRKEKSLPCNACWDKTIQSSVRMVEVKSKNDENPKEENNFFVLITFR